jgi:hypothetical protein
LPRADFEPLSSCSLPPALCLLSSYGYRWELPVPHPFIFLMFTRPVQISYITLMPVCVSFCKKLGARRE